MDISTDIFSGDWPIVQKHCIILHKCYREIQVALLFAASRLKPSSQVLTKASRSSLLGPWPQLHRSLPAMKLNLQHDNDRTLTHALMVVYYLVYLEKEKKRRQHSQRRRFCVKLWLKHERQVIGFIYAHRSKFQTSWWFAIGHACWYFVLHLNRMEPSCSDPVLLSIDKQYSTTETRTYKVISVRVRPLI